MRAEVALLERNVVVRGDDTSEASQFGATTVYIHIYLFIYILLTFYFSLFNQLIYHYRCVTLMPSASYPMCSSVKWVMRWFVVVMQVIIYFHFCISTDLFSSFVIC